MQPNSYLKLNVLVVALIFAGCTASFEPRLSSYDLTKNRLPTVKEVQRGVEVSVEEFVSANKSRRAFDADVAPHGVLALLVRVENKGTENYKVQRSQVRAFFDGQPLPQIYGHEAATQGATRDYVWNALVNTVAMGPLAMYFGVAGMAATANQTKSINRKIEQHFESLEFNDTVVKPDETVAGFVFFNLPERLKRVENLTMEVTVEIDSPEEPGGRRLNFNLPLPTLEVS
ncbi:MAG: hypothetical protein ACREQA_04820 [Candidatus Binatia bacterium]